MIDTPRVALLPPSGGVASAPRIRPAVVDPTRPLRTRRDEAAVEPQTGVRGDDAGGGEPPDGRAPRPTIAVPAGGRENRLAFLAQHIAQEVLPTGLYREPWRLGETAYRRAGGEPPLPEDAPAAVCLAV